MIVKQVHTTVNQQKKPQKTNETFRKQDVRKSKKNPHIDFKDYDCHILRYRLDEIIILRVREVRCRMNYDKKKSHC